MLPWVELVGKLLNVLLHKVLAGNKPGVFVVCQKKVIEILLAGTIISKEKRFCFFILQMQPLSKLIQRPSSLALAYWSRHRNGLCEIGSYLQLKSLGGNKLNIHSSSIARFFMGISHLIYPISSLPGEADLLLLALAELVVLHVLVVALA